MQTPMERLEAKYDRFEKQMNGELPPRKRKTHLLTPAYYQRKMDMFERRHNQLQRGRPKVRMMQRKPKSLDEAAARMNDPFTVENLEKAAVEAKK